MISLVRIDERLLHGQVAVTWVNYSKATHVVVIDDGVANNPMLTRMFTSVAPQGKPVLIVSVADAAGLILKPEYTAPECRLLVVTKHPSTVLKLMNEGVEVKKVNIGNMGGETGRKRYTQHFFATQEEVGMFKEIASRGAEVFCQNLPDMSRKDLSKVVK